MKDFYEFPVDAIIATDEWDHMRYLISQEIKTCDYEEIGEFYSKRGFPFLRSFEIWIERKLIKYGFKKEFIKEEIWLKGLIHTVNFEQNNPYQDYRWDINPPFGFPSGTYKMSEDKHTLWFNPEIEAALRVLELIKIMKELLITDGVVNKQAVKVYLRSLELIITLVRAGVVPGIAKAKIDADTNSKKTREIKKSVMKEAISNIFKLKPETKKTLGGVWKEFDTVNKDTTFYTSKSDIHRLGKGGYTVKKGKDKKGDAVICILKDKKIFCDPYARKSLQHFIDELKNTL